MPRLIYFLLGLVGTCSQLWAQRADFACLAPSLAGLDREQIIERLRAAPEDFLLNKRLIDLTPTRPRPGTLAAVYQQKLERHPDDARYLYLYAHSLIGKNTRESIALLERAAEAEPRLPWTHTDLAEIHASRNFADDAKVLAHMRAYRKLCPSNTDGFRYLNKVKDPAESGTDARQLRALLESPDQPEDNDQYWRPLWAAEFRAAAAADYDALRKRVAHDLERLETRAQPRGMLLQLALADGYRLTGREEMAVAIERRWSPDQEAIKAYREWEAKHGLRTRNLRYEEYDAIFADQFKMSAEWVEKWPTSYFAWSMRLNGLAARSNDKAEIERAGVEALKANAAAPIPGWSDLPREMDVARAWVRGGVRLADAVAMAERSLAEILLGPEIPSDLTTSNVDQSIASHAFGFDTSVWGAMTVILEGAAKLRDFAKARAMLARMRKWLDENQIKKNDPTSGYPLRQAEYLYCAGEIEEAEGHKQAALALFVRSLATLRDPDRAKRVRALWDETGGSAEGFAIATARMPAPAERPPTTPPPRVAIDFNPWVKVGFALPELKLRDLAGKTWTLADLKGKTTFVNVWATWCVPCREELPLLQKLYEAVRDRSDVQVITLNIDENPGEVEPYMRGNRYSFPALLLGRSYAESVGPLAIPQNWLVDASGTILQKSGGFDGQPDWPKRMLERLTGLKPAL